MEEIMDKIQKNDLLTALKQLSNKSGIYVFPAAFSNAYDYILSKTLHIPIEGITENLRKELINLLLKYNIKFPHIEFISASK